MGKMYSPLRYPGGKGQIYATLLNILEKNDLLGCTYIEPFAGGAGLAIRLLFENKVNKVIINDFDKSIYSVWYSILNYTEEFISLIENTPITINEWEKQKQIQRNKDNVNVLQLGFSTLFLNRTNHSGIIKAGVIGGKNQSGKYKIDCRFNKKTVIELIKKIANYKDKIELYNLEAMDFINIVKSQRNQFYFIDPPYYNNGKQLYTNFFNDEHHAELKKYVTKNMKTKKFIISYDDCLEIRSLYKNYPKKNISLKYSLEKKKDAIELFMFHNIKI